MLFPILGLVGFAGTVIGAILLIVMILRDKPILIPGILLLVSALLVGVAVFMIIREDSEPEDQSSKVGADVGLFNVTLTIPPDFVDEGMTQEKLDSDAKNKTYKSATLNPDGSVTYVMSKKQHRELMDGIKESIDQGLEEMAGSEDYPNFVSIEPNKDYTNFKVTIKSEEVGLVESFSVLAFYTYGGMYNAFNGTPVDNVCVQFVNEANGKVIQEANSKDIGQATPDNPDEDQPASNEGEKTYSIGETWVVPGQWELTITGVTETAERNQFSDKNPGAVYIIDYTYKNLGYEDEIMDGLFMSIDGNIVDSAGKMGESYPGDIKKHAKETPVGATCDAQECIGVENPGDFTLTVSTYDGNDVKQKAVFSVQVG